MHSTFWILVYLFICVALMKRSILCCFLGLVKMGDMIYDATCDTTKSFLLELSSENMSLGC